MILNTVTEFILIHSYFSDASSISKIGEKMADTLSLNSSSSQQTSSAASSQNSLVLVRIGVPELGVEKCLQYQKDEVIWEVKQQALAALPKVRPTHFYSYLASFYV